MTDDKFLAHYGRPHDDPNKPGRGSGRYAWGSGKKYENVLRSDKKIGNYIDLKSINPWRNDVESTNCTNSVVAMELVVRGYKVKASNKHRPTLPYETRNMFNAPKGSYRCGNFSSLSKYMQCLEEVNPSGGNSLLLTIEWDGVRMCHDLYARSYNDGHKIEWEVIDPQRGYSFGSLENLANESGCSTSKIGWLRLDNRTLNVDYLESIRAIERING